MPILLRSHSVDTPVADHRHLYTKRCVVCGTMPADEDDLTVLLTLWSRLTFEQQRSFLLRVKTRATE